MPEGQTYQLRNTSEPIKISEITYETTMNDEGEIGYCFNVTVVNEGSSMEKETLDKVTGEQLIFKDNFSKIPTAFSLDELKKNLKDGIEGVSK